MPPTDPQPLSAADLGAVQARLVAIRVALPFGEMHPGRRADLMTARALQVLDDADVLLATARALEAERDAARRDVQLMRGSFAAVTAERDQARADLKRIADRLCREDEEYAAKVARLAALEAAARRSVAANQAGATGDLVAADRELEQAVAALDAAPGGAG